MTVILPEDVTPVLLTGGLGTRLRQVVADKPKTMANVAGRPFIEYILEQLQAANFNNAVLCVGYMSEQIQQHFGASFGSLKLEYSVERALLGTGGAVRFALSKVPTKYVLVLNADSFCGQALDQFLLNHFASGHKASMLVTQVADTQRYGRVNFSEDNKIVNFDEKGSVSGAGWINAGIYLFEKDLLTAIPAGRNLSLEKEIFPEMCDRGELYAFQAKEKVFIDIGTPESFAVANSLFSSWGTSLRPSLQSSEHRQ